MNLDTIPQDAHTSAGLDQENNAPEKANETQSAGVPV